MIIINKSRSSVHQTHHLVVRFFAVALIIFILTATQTEAQSVIEIRNIQSTVKDTSVVVRWETNMPAQGRVDFGITENLGLYAHGGYSDRIYHEITMSNLKPETTYFYKVSSASPGGSSIAFIRSIKTLKRIDKGDSPIISNVSAVFVTGTTATIQWETDEDATTVVRFGRTEQYSGSRSASGYSKIHDITLVKLSIAATYHYTVESKDRHGNIAKYHDVTFTTALTGEGESALLEIRDIKPLTLGDPAVRETNVELSWRTTKLAGTSIYFGPDTRIRSRAIVPGPRGFEHRLKLENLQPGARYFYRIYAADVFGKKINTELLSFTTKSGDVAGTQKPRPASGMTFLARFDGSMNADFGVGNVTGEAVGSVTVALNGGKRGGAIHLGEGAQVKFDGAGNFNIGQGTIAFWVKPGWTADDKLTHTLFQLNPNYRKSNDKFFTIAKLASYAKYANPFYFGTEDSRDAQNDHILDDAILPTGEWHHVSVTWKYGGETVVFVDGKEFSRLKNGGAAPSLGSAFYLGSAAAKSTVNAYLDEFVIFDRALLNKEVRALFTDGPHAIGSATADIPSVLGYSTDVAYTRPSKLVRAFGSEKIYAVYGNEKLLVPTPASFSLHGYGWGAVRTISSEELNAIPDVSLVRSAQNGTVYYLSRVTEGRINRLRIPGPSVFESYQRNDWKRVITIDETDIQHFSETELVRLHGSSSFYSIENNEKRLVGNAHVLISRGLSEKDAVQVSEKHLASFRTGMALK